MDLRTTGARAWLFGAAGETVGYGTDAFHVRTIPAADARAIIRANHYSGSVVNNSYVHLGVFHAGTLSGALQ